LGLSLASALRSLDPFAFLDVVTEGGRDCLQTSDSFHGRCYTFGPVRLGEPRDVRKGRHRRDLQHEPKRGLLVPALLTHELADKLIGHRPFRVREVKPSQKLRMVAEGRPQERLIVALVPGDGGQGFTQCLVGVSGDAFHNCSIPPCRY